MAGAVVVADDVCQPDWCGVTKAERIGRQVLDNLAEGRKALAEINEERRQRAAWYQRVIADYVLLDQQAGWPSWGMAGRIARKLKGQLSERQVRKYLAQLASGSECSKYGASHNLGGLTP